MPLLAWALTGDSQKIDTVTPLVKPAQLKGYARLSLLGKDYPVVIKHEDSSVVDGLLLCGYGMDRLTRFRKTLGIWRHSSGTDSRIGSSKDLS